MSAPKLDADAVQKALESLPGWKQEGESLHKVYRFADFSTAWAFMSRCALMAEKINHHPEWSNVYSTVDVTLSTHDSGGITEKDTKMAEQMEIYSKSEN